MRLHFAASFIDTSMLHVAVTFVFRSSCKFNCSFGESIEDRSLVCHAKSEIHKPFYHIFMHFIAQFSIVNRPNVKPKIKWKTFILQFCSCTAILLFQNKLNEKKLFSANLNFFMPIINWMNAVRSVGKRKYWLRT